MKPNDCIKCKAPMRCLYTYRPQIPGFPPAAERTRWRCDNCEHESETLPIRKVQDR